MIEPLESRIAPAGLVAVTVDRGNVTLASSGGDTDLLIQQVDAKTWALTGRNGTLVQVGAGAPSDLAFATGITGFATLALGGDDDIIYFDRVVVPKGLLINAGDGDNTVELRHTRIGGFFTYNGGIGGDFVSFYGDKVTTGDSVGVFLGEGNGGFALGAESASISGDLNVLGGSGPESFFLYGGVIGVKGNLLVDLGAGGTTDIQINPRSLSVGRAMTIMDSDTGNVVKVNPRAALKVGGKLEVEGRAGVDTIEVGVGSVRVSVGALKINTAFDNDTDVVKVTPSALLDVKGNLDVFFNAGDSDTRIESEILRVGGTLLVESGGGGAASGDALIIARSELTVGRDLFLRAAADVARATVVAEGRLQVGGTLGFTNGELLFASLFVAQGKVGGSLGASSGDPASGADLDIDGTNLSVKGDLAVVSDGSAELIADLTNLTIGRDLQMLAPTNAVTLDLDIERTLAIGRDLRAIAGSGVFTSILDVGAARIARDLDFTAVATTATTRFIGELGRIQVGGNLNLLIAASASTSTRLANLSVGGLFQFTTGAGADTLRLDDSVISGSASFTMNAGNDFLLMEQLPYITRGSTLFKSNVTIDLGEGSDALSLAVPAGPAFNARFLKAVSFEGGPGSDSLGVSPNVTFAISGQPTVAGFE
jgi:hypothetical protein